MFGALGRYARWLHLGWPGGTVEKLPYVRDDGTTNVPGVYIVGDLRGVPLLKFSAHSGSRAVQDICSDPSFIPSQDDSVLDLVIVGGGISGAAAAMEAKRRNLRFVVYEGTRPFSTIKNFPQGKPIFTYPTQMIPAGQLQFNHEIKEALVDDLEQQLQKVDIRFVNAQVEAVKRRGRRLSVMHRLDGNTQIQTTLASRVIIAIGRSGNYRSLDVPGENLESVYNRLHDPKEFAGKSVMVVGGGDSALEAAIALTKAGAHTTLSYRGPKFTRPKPDNLENLKALVDDVTSDESIDEAMSVRTTTEVSHPLASHGRLGSITLEMSSTVLEVEPTSVRLKTSDGRIGNRRNDAVFCMLGREAPLDFFRRSGIRINGEWRFRSILSLITVLALFTFIYHWKKTGVWLPIGEWWAERQYFPYGLTGWWQEQYSDRTTLLGTVHACIGSPGFWYSLVYTLTILVFGIRRIQRRKTPYVRVQTTCLFLFQAIPLFLLPYILLPYMGFNGVFDSGIGKLVADEFFPVVTYDASGREYWRAFGFILAWPLFFWNVFTSEPMWGWLVVSLVQTGVLIPLMIRRWGKGVYCGWICSCGALAETLGDTHRNKMPHGPQWNKLNLIGQVFLLLAIILLCTRIVSWWTPQSTFGVWCASIYAGMLNGFPGLNYVWFVDLLFAGIIGVGLYFHFSGRVWCRFACPLAALMHVYARFSKFRIFAEKKKCISCNVCTSVCHQGIDIMNFANQGVPMEDPQCVRCSACVHSCPTGVLQFGRYGHNGEVVYDRLPASLVRLTEALHQK